jgi:NAD(P) transhydrogenase subunit alpha
MIVGLPKETYPQERRVALAPASLAGLAKAGISVVVEAGAGATAGFSDQSYVEKGARLAASRQELFQQADVIVQVRAAGANPQAAQADLELFRTGQTLIALAEPLSRPQDVLPLAQRGVTLLALELIPRITRAQGMDVLSSMATLAGYKAVLLAADNLPRVFPLLMTAAGTLSPAHMLVIGAGVAGLTAIAVGRRLGAVVEGYDIRPEAAEQVQSLGARFVKLPLETEVAKGTGGYAAAQADEVLLRQRQLLGEVIARQDVVIATAAVPGRKAPVLIDRAAVEAMADGSVIVDLAAEQGGNCELTVAGQTIRHGGATIIGAVNLPSSVPHHASQMFSHNVSALLTHLVKDGRIVMGGGDEILRSITVCHDGQVVLPQAAQSPGQPQPKSQ